MLSLDGVDGRLPAALKLTYHRLQLSKYPALVNLEKSTSVPKAYAVIGIITLYFFLIVFNLGGQLLTNLAGFVIPGYYSLEALFTASKHDDTQWLTVSSVTLFARDINADQFFSTGLYSPCLRKLHGHI